MLAANGRRGGNPTSVARSARDQISQIASMRTDTKEADAGGPKMQLKCYVLSSKQTTAPATSSDLNYSMDITLSVIHAIEFVFVRVSEPPVTPSDADIHSGTAPPASSSSMGDYVTATPLNF